MLLVSEAIEVAREMVTAEDFYRPAHGHIYAAIINLHRSGGGVDPVTVADRLARDGLLDAIGGSAELNSIQAATPATGNAASYARIVAEMSAQRRLISLGREIAEVGWSERNPVAAVDRVQDL
jgi:replicative DNA helicase